MIKIFRQRWEYISLQIGGKIGVNFWVRLRSAEDGITPYRMFGIFVWGTFFGRNPYLSRRCASNGITLFVANLTERRK